MKNSKKTFLLLSILFLSCFIISSKAIRASSIVINGYNFDLKSAGINRKQATPDADTLSKKELFSRIKKVVAKVLDVKQENIKMQSRYIDDLGADDLSLVEIVMALEEEFHISIPDDDAEKLTTVQKTYDYLIKKMKIKK